ncbi:MAG: hypothetical protein IPP90_01305 [Gemmatimonadaceae bacterium]|nr:hypothetical protein [Gemmatimonadaceae bacterium]
MSGNQIQPSPRDAAVDVYQDALPTQDWGGGQETAPAPSGPKIGRYLSALYRFKWLIVLFAILGGGAGYAATKFVEPEYEVRATIMLEMGTGTNQGGRGGPIRASELLQSSGWQDLLRSFAIADPVVNQLALFVAPARDADSTLFSTFRVAQQLKPGDYVLSITGDRYSLSFKPGVEVETGSIADSIGRRVGFLWQPGAQELAGRKQVEFRIQTPREASQALIRKLGMTLNEGSSFMLLKLTGNNSNRTATTLNAWVERFVMVATALKKKNVTSYATILEGQRQYAADNLSSAEGALERFRVQTATEPSERQSASAGIELTTNPVFDAYFRDKILSENYKHDRESIERVLALGKTTGGITREALLSIPLVANDPAADNLRTALKEQADRDANLRRLRESLTDENPRIVKEQEALDNLRTVTVPGAARSSSRSCAFASSCFETTST